MRAKQRGQGSAAAASHPPASHTLSPTTPILAPVSLEGKKIEDDDTPESLNMEEGDVVDALLQQTGGARAR
jgi:hypothetical protein